MDDQAPRPVRFRHLLGQEGVRERLVQAASGGRLPHAYLFCGVEGCGRKTAARMLAALLGCERPQIGEACGECRSCRKLSRDTHPDLMLIAPEAEAKKGKGDKGEPEEPKDKEEKQGTGRKGREIKIGQVRELCRRLSFAPVEARVRVSVIWPAGRLNEESSNALLKTLEEPPANNLLILCAREPGEVLPTIASRCQVVSFAPLPEAVVKDWLLAHGADEARAERLAYLSGGSLTRAERLLEPGFWEDRERFLRASCQPAPVAEILSLSAELWPSRQKEEEARERLDLIHDLLEAAKSCFRDALALSATGGRAALINSDFQEPLRALAARCTPAGLARRFELVERAEEALAANCSAQLALEVLLFSLADNQESAHA